MEKQLASEAYLAATDEGEKRADHKGAAGINNGFPYVGRSRRGSRVWHLDVSQNII
jgi:hypothetical protein